MQGGEMVDGAGQTRSAPEELRAGQVVVCDGAMGTMLHAAGIPLDRSLPELNLSRPVLVRDLHAAYVSAGARLARIEAITRLDLGDPDDRLVTHVAVKIIELQDSVGTGSREC